MISETRRHDRADFDRRVWCEHQSLTLYLPAANVSHGGMFLQTSTPFSLGDVLRVSFDAPEAGVRIVAQLEIVWSGTRGRVPGVGCKVLGFLEGGAAYAKLVDSLLPRKRPEDS